MPAKFTPIGSSPQPELSIVMPCYNESAGIESLLTQWLLFLRSLGVSSFEIVVINDGSTDGTGRMLDKLRRENRELRVFHQLNVGHGRAIRRGYETARGRYVAQVDSNGCYEVSDFLRLWEQKERYAMVLGRRTHRLDSIFHRGAARVSRRLIAWLFDVHLNDPSTPFRIMRNDVLKTLLAQIPPHRHSTNLALSVLFKRQGDAAVYELAVPFRFRSSGKNRVGGWASLMATGMALRELVALRLVTVKAVPT